MSQATRILLALVLGLGLGIATAALGGAWTDNAVMIASAGRYVEPLESPHYLDLDVYASTS